MDLTEQDLRDYLCRRSRLSSQIVEFIKIQKETPDTRIAKWFNQLEHRLTAKPDDVDWAWLLADVESLADASTFFHTDVEAEIERYLSLSDKELENEFVRCLPAEELEMAMRSGNDFLAPAESTEGKASSRNGGNDDLRHGRSAALWG